MSGRPTHPLPCPPLFFIKYPPNQHKKEIPEYQNLSNHSPGDDDQSTGVTDRCAERYKLRPEALRAWDSWCMR